MPEIADADEVGDGWMRESLADAARREREYVAWEAAHGAERDEQLASIANADFYWALPHEIGRRPRWQLREAKHRAQDGICTVGRNELDVEEPFLRYRSFLPFTGNVLRAQEFFAASVWERDEAWLDDERLKLGPGEATRPSQPPSHASMNVRDGVERAAAISDAASVAIVHSRAQRWSLRASS